MARQERSAGYVIYTQVPAPGEAASAIQFLLLNYGRHWDFPKGHVEKGEDDLTTANRELFEETGMKHAERVPGFRQEITYFFRHRRHGVVRKTVIFFLGRVDTREVILSEEHTGYVFLPFEEALKRLTFPTARQVLREAWKRLCEPAEANAEKCVVTTETEIHADGQEDRTGAEN